MPANPFPLIAVDIGNNRMKLGLFPTAPAAVGLPEPSRTIQIAGDRADFERLEGWLAGLAPGAVSWWIGSVNRPATTRLVDWLRGWAAACAVRLLACGDLRLCVELERPDMVGIDRLLDALAANRLRRPNRPAVMVDVGTAITVDLVSAAGAFLGGAIAPGIGMSARALHAFTDLLPLLDMAELSAPPPPLGQSTLAAMQSGLFWGAVGTIRQLIGELTGRGPQPQVFLTGGAAPSVAGLLGAEAEYVPHLTLAGIALAASEAAGA